MLVQVAEALKKPKTKVEPGAPAMSGALTDLQTRLQGVKDFAAVFTALHLYAHAFKATGGVVLQVLEAEALLSVGQSGSAFGFDWSHALGVRTLQAQCVDSAQVMVSRSFTPPMLDPLGFYPERPPVQAMAIPLKSAGHVVGVLTLLAKEGMELGEPDARQLNLVGLMAGIEVARLVAAQYRSPDEDDTSMDGLINTIELCRLREQSAASMLAAG